MFHIIYISKATMPLSKSGLTDLLNTSRQKNERLMLTGLLLYSGERFMQILEGRKSAVTEVYGSIQLDNRHTDITTLRMESKESRHFPDWRMGFQDINEEAGDLRSISHFLEPGYDDLALNYDSNDVYDLLRAFRDIHSTNHHINKK